MLKLNTVGDTIVEVLIGMAVLGSILTAGYSISTRSLNTVRVAQERSEALKVAEGQMELLRNRLYGVSTTTSDAYKDITQQSGESGFCFASGSDSTAHFTMPGSATIEDVGLYQAIAPGCVINNLYHVAITTQDKNTRVTVGATPQNVKEVTFSVNVFWERSGGGELQKLTLNYKTVI